MKPYRIYEYALNAAQRKSNYHVRLMEGLCLGKGKTVNEDLELAFPLATSISNIPGSTRTLRCSQEKYSACTHRPFASFSITFTQVEFPRMIDNCGDYNYSN